MSFKTVDVVLAADVATGGTFTVGYPTGTTKGDFAYGVNHSIFALQTSFAVPTKATMSFGATTVTVTYNGTTTIKAGSTVKVQLDMSGENKERSGAVRAMDSLRNTANVNFALLPLVEVSLGTPLTLQAAGLRAAAAVASSAALTLIQTFVDVPRNITILSAGNDSGRTFTVTSKDVYGNTVIENITGANAGTANGIKAHFTSITVAADAACAGNVSIGWGDVLGLPLYLPNAVYIVKELLDGASATAGTTVAGLAINTKSTATTADVRGTYVPNSATNASRSWKLLLALPDPSFTGNPQFAG